MKADIDRKSLSGAIKSVIRASSAKSTLPVLANIHIQADQEQGSLKLTATDLEIGIATWVSAHVTEGGATTVPAKTFSDLVNVSGNGEQVKMSLLKGDTLKMKAGTVTSKLKGIPADEFPAMGSIPEGEGIEFSVAELKDLIKQTAFAASPDFSRPVLSGIYFEFGENELVVASADGFRLSKVITALPEGVNGKEMRTAIIPAKALKQLSTTLDKREQVTLHLTDGKAFFQAEDLVFMASLIDGSYPDFEGIIPDGYKTRAIMNADMMLRSCKAAHVFARDMNNNVRLNLGPGEGEIEMSAQAQETGSNQTAIEPESMEGDELLVGFNVKYLMEFLNTKGGEKIVFESNGPSSPGVFRFEGDEDFLHVLMPMQIGK